ncbi:DUF222 domain-containing protein [Nocardioides hankookensis]|uniref:DUF222 domain-containing protein n=1 Tax=Nocardioides hankookensis TaxID=443157 RepID=A0ABW1LRY4_9ACTN
MTTPRHRVATATAQMRAAADAVVDASMWSMDVVETAQTLVELTRLEAQVVELRSRVARHADDLEVGHETGATSTANWLAHETKQTRPAAHRTVRLGYDLDPDLVARAEQHLVEAAQEHDAKALKILGRRLLEVVAPEIADAHEAQLLERDEAEAATACRLTMTDDGHGKVHGQFTMPVVQAAALKKMLQALAAPKHQAATHGAGVERRPGPERMGRAFCELIERISAKDLPKVGGRDATIVVTLSYESLIGQVDQAGVLDTGEPISPGQVRRLACTARIVPVALGGDSEVLDVGRARRFFTKAQLTAMAIRDRGCVAEGCDCPPWMCHGRHWIRWADGGPTDLDDGGLLCP